mmetsp:Transcript_9955/g.20702  ORF Transcript_9955/g.20702 Transcript_9955/m.20702 type:complete len:85 (-) Transcript_9955:28-282(-)
MRTLVFASDVHGLSLVLIITLHPAYHSLVRTIIAKPASFYLEIVRRIKNKHGFVLTVAPQTKMQPALGPLPNNEVIEGFLALSL